MEKDFWEADGDKGLLVVGVDLGENEAAAKRFEARHHLTYPVLVDSDEASLPKPGFGFAVPYNIVVDQNGVVRYSEVGFRSAELARVLEQLLAPGAPGSQTQTTRLGSP